MRTLTGSNQHCNICQRRLRRGLRVPLPLSTTCRLSVPHAAALAAGSETAFGFDVGLAKLRRRGGVDSLLGWTVEARRQRAVEHLGTVVEVVRPNRPGVRVVRTRSSGGLTGVLLKARRSTMLEPHGFVGIEEHFVPLAAEFITAMHLDSKRIVVSLPKGFLALGRRGLYLSFLADQLPQYSLPIKAVQIGRNEMRYMPTRKELEAAGRKDLVDLVLKCGGFSEVAVELGMRSKRRPMGYWDSPENLDAEVRAFVAGQWAQLADSGGKPYYYNLVSGRVTLRLPGGSSLADVRKLALLEDPRDHVMPSRSQLTEVGRFDLHHAIVGHGGYLVVGHMLRRKAPRDGRERMIASEQELLLELQNFMRQGQEEELLPGADAARPAEEVGGLAEAAAEVSSKDKMEQDVHWAAEDEGAAAEAVDKAEQEADAGSSHLEHELPPPHRLTDGSHLGNTALQQSISAADGLPTPLPAAASLPARLPSHGQLLQAGRGDIVSAINRYGGYAKVAELAGLQSRRRARGYWRNIDNVVAEVKAFMAAEQAAAGRQQTEDGAEPATLLRSGIRGGALGLTPCSTALPPALEQDTRMGSLGPGSPGFGPPAADSRGQGGRSRAGSEPEAAGGGLERRGSEQGGSEVGTSGDLSSSTATGRRSLPTQRELIKAGRMDLLYAIQLHGHEFVTTRCGLQVEQRGLAKQKLSKKLIREALAGGPLHPGQLLAWLKKERRVTVTLDHLDHFLARPHHQSSWARDAQGAYSLR